MGYRYLDIHSQIVKESVMSRIIIGVAGLKQSGKDTLANYLEQDYYFRKFHLAQPLKDGARNLGWNGTKDNTEFGRPFLEWLGMDVFKKRFGRDYFAKQLFKQGFPNCSPYMNIVIPDVRDKEEADYIREQGGKIILVHRTHPEHLKMIEENPSISDDRLKLITPDFRIINDSDIPSFLQKVQQLLIDEYKMRTEKSCFSWGCDNLTTWSFANEGIQNGFRFYSCDEHRDKCAERMLVQVYNNEFVALEVEQIRHDKENFSVR